MKIKFEVTPRGFGRFEFKDRNKEECSLQQSSLATENAIWFGIDDVVPTCYDGTPKPYPLPKNVNAYGRMHLTQKQVKELLPYLQYFADNGELPSPEELNDNDSQKLILNCRVREEFT